MNEIIENFIELKFAEVTSENIFHRNYFQSMNTNLLSIQLCTQGINWTDLNRERIRQFRLSHHSGFRNNQQTNEERTERNLFLSSAKKDIFFQFSIIYKNIPVNVKHFQLRKNLIKLSSEIYYIRTFGIEKFNLVTNKRKMLVLFSGDELTNDGIVVSFDVFKDDNLTIIACGKLNSKVAMFNIKNFTETEMSNPICRIKISDQESQIANFVKFIDDGKKLLVCCNDSYVKVIDLHANNKIQNCFKGDLAINHCATNTSQNQIALVGDFETVNLFDYKSTELITKLKGHTDFGFSSYFKPNSDFILATGNQDYNCKLWDIRKIQTNNDNYNSSLNSPACFKTLYGHFDAIGEMKFFNEELLIFAENTDYLHIYNLNSDSLQTFEYFGKSVGMDVDRQLDKIFIGIEEENNFGIMTYDKIKNNKICLNNILI